MRERVCACKCVCMYLVCRRRRRGNDVTLFTSFFLQIHREYKIMKKGGTGSALVVSKRERATTDSHHFTIWYVFAVCVWVCVCRFVESGWTFKGSLALKLEMYCGVIYVWFFFCISASCYRFGHACVVYAFGLNDFMLHA